MRQLKLEEAPAPVSFPQHKGPHWVPASGGSERPFVSRSGIRMQYMWDMRSGDHAYMNCDTDIIMSDEEAFAALGMQ